MLFDHRTAAGIADGSVTVTFRRWRRRQAVPGRRYRTPVGFIEVDAVDVVDPSSITAADAGRAGHESAEAVRASLRGDTDAPVHRVAFRFVGGPDPRAELAGRESLTDDELAQLRRRLDRMDRRADRAPWTTEVLRLIEANPGVRAADLAAQLGWPRDDFKVDVRKLKALGLTISLEVGYRLSPRGEAFLASR